MRGKTRLLLAILERTYLRAEVGGGPAIRPQVSVITGLELECRARFINSEENTICNALDKCL